MRRSGRSYWTSDSARPIWLVMAKRLLLTLLALLGLAAQVAPAHAGVCERAASALVQAAEEGAAAVAVAGAPVRRALPVCAGKGEDAAVPGDVAPARAPVLIGIDRARE